MKKLIVNADDLGANTSINRAIIEAFDRNYINSATLMANMPGAEEAFDLVHQYHLADKIGVHLVLTQGRPLTESIRSLPQLVGEDGNFFRAGLKTMFLLNSEAKKLVYREYAAQIEKVRKHNIRISHVDTHHQIHDVWPIMNIILALLKEYQIPGMRILNNMEPNSPFHKVAYRRLANIYLKSKSAHFTDLMGSQVDYVYTLEHRHSRLRDRTVEVMVHPVFGQNGTLVDRVGQKEYDLQFLPSSD